MIPTDSIELTALTTYLSVRGWERQQSDDRRSIWRHRNGAHVFVPAQRDVDFEDLINLAVRQISSADERDPDDIAVDLIWYRFDKLHVRRESPATGLAVSTAIDLHQATQDAILAAARAANEPRRRFSGRAPLSVVAFMDQVRIVPSVPGSFVVRALVPLALEDGNLHLPMLGPADPDVRAVTTTLLRASAIAVDTARNVASGASLSAWDSAVESGVSANLCDALALLAAGGDDLSGSVEMRVDWTFAVPSSVDTRVIVPSGVVPVLEAASAYLRDEPEEFTIRITGLVTRLHRETVSGPGEITIRGFIEHWDSPAARSLRVELDESTYRRAIAAHEEGQSVRATALVRRAPRSFDVLRMQDFEVLA